MTVTEINTTQLLLLKARANNFANYRPTRELSVEHGELFGDIDQCLALGLVRHFPGTVLHTCEVILHLTNTIYVLKYLGSLNCKSSSL